MKRLFDLVLSSLALLLLWPAFLLIALWIKIDSPGPVFHRGLRSGLGGTTFRIFKFRTMMERRGEAWGLSTAKNDPRVTRVGRFLRRHKIDELPQMINILRGEMSFVGPRPEMPEYTALYDEEEKAILTVKPGLTDFASLEFINLGEVLGDEEPDRKYEEEIRPKKNALRLRYVKEQSFSTDIRLIVRTAVKVLGL